MVPRDGNFPSMAAKRWTKIGRAGRLRAWGGVSSLKQRGRWQVIPHSTPGASWPSPASYSIMEGSLVSRIWSVRIQGIDISIGNWMRRPMVNSRKNSRNQSWERSQHCCRASGRAGESLGLTDSAHTSRRLLGTGCHCYGHRHARCAAGTSYTTLP